MCVCVGCGKGGWCSQPATATHCWGAGSFLLARKCVRVCPSLLPAHTHVQLIDELDEEMDSTQTRLAAAQKKVQYVLERAGTKGQLIIIVLLAVLLVVLIFIAFS